MCRRRRQPAVRRQQAPPALANAPRRPIHKRAGERETTMAVLPCRGQHWPGGGGEVPATVWPS